jgi:hypothetical protein
MGGALFRLPPLGSSQSLGLNNLCPLSRDYASWNLSVNLYTVNAPWLFSLLWCAGVPSVTSDNSHTLSQVPSPLWIMVSWRLWGTEGDLWPAPTLGKHCTWSFPPTLPQFA